MTTVILLLVLLALGLCGKPPPDPNDPQANTPSSRANRDRRTSGSSTHNPPSLQPPTHPSGSSSHPSSGTSSSYVPLGLSVPTTNYVSFNGRGRSSSSTTLTGQPSTPRIPQPEPAPSSRRTSQSTGSSRRVYLDDSDDQEDVPSSSARTPHVSTRSQHLTVRTTSQSTPHSAPASSADPADITISVDDVRDWLDHLRIRRLAGRSMSDLAPPNLPGYGVPLPIVPAVDRVGRKNSLPTLAASSRGARSPISAALQPPTSTGRCLQCGEWLYEFERTCPPCQSGQARPVLQSDSHNSGTDSQTNGPTGALIPAHSGESHHGPSSNYAPSSSSFEPPPPSPLTPPPEHTTSSPYPFVPDFTEGRFCSECSHYVPPGAHSCDGCGIHRDSMYNPGLSRFHQPNYCPNCDMYPSDPTGTGRICRFCGSHTVVIYDDPTPDPEITGPGPVPQYPPSTGSYTPSTAGHNDPPYPSAAHGLRRESLSSLGSDGHAPVGPYRPPDVPDTRGPKAPPPVAPRPPPSRPPQQPGWSGASAGNQATSGPPRNPPSDVHHGRPPPSRVSAPT